MILIHILMMECKISDKKEEWNITNMFRNK